MNKTIKLNDLQIKEIVKFNKENENNIFKKKEIENIVNKNKIIINENNYIELFNTIMCKQISFIQVYQNHEIIKILTKISNACKKIYINKNI